ncbi:MAG: GspH/FimT family pseudopilin [Gammaproteobacteria bacterium]|nr:GspH/FimT family pseudopilin [Gammaproteobacteria bacterium]
MYTHTQRALSLIEILITLFLLSITAGMVVSGLKSFFNHTNAELLQSQLLHTIEFAHTEALIRQVPIGLCQSKNGKACGGNWAQGQLIFSDENEDGHILTNEQILLVTQTHLKNGMVFWRSFPAYRHYLQFSSTGSLSNDNGTFWFCADEAKNPTWAIMINKLGRVRSVHPDQQGEIKDDKGKPLLCV